jgi:hypothetical protein
MQSRVEPETTLIRVRDGRRIAASRYGPDDAPVTMFYFLRRLGLSSAPTRQTHSGQRQAPDGYPASERSAAAPSHPDELQQRSSSRREQE